MLAITELKQAEAELIRMNDTLAAFVAKANEEAANNKALSTETKTALTNLVGKCDDATARVMKMEQRIAEILENGLGDPASKRVDFGAEFTKSEGYKALAPFAASETLSKHSARMQWKSSFFEKTAIINATGLNQPLVPADYQPQIIMPARRALRMRDVLAVGRTGSNMITYPKENVFTNNAGPQISGSPQAFENVVKPESAITFTLANEPVVTIAHWIPVSKQVLSDAPMLESYINGRLMYGLKLKEDTEILVGTGANGRMNGLYTNRTAYSMTSPLTYTTRLDIIRDAMRQVQNSEYDPNAIVLHTTDWAKMELSKDSTGRYLFANPQSAAQPLLWGLPVVVSNSIAAGSFLLGAFDQAAMLWDREDASVEVGLNNDNFTRNMVTILCEERVALTIFRAAAIVGGSLTAS